MMARGFTDEERQRLRAELLATARTLFTRYGLKKTTLRELTDPLGIAKSSFYLFFDSKEALYWQLLLEEAPAVEAKIRAAVARAGDTRTAVEALLRATVDETESNDLYRRLLDHPAELERVLRRLPPEATDAKAQGSLALILAYVRDWQADGHLIEAPRQVVASALRAVTLLTLHREEIGPALYPAVMDLLIRVVADGLTDSRCSDTRTQGDSDVTDD
jgi:AcrR family transcriptional regulator